MKQEDLCKTCENYWTDFPLPLEQAESHCIVWQMKKLDLGKWMK